MKITFTTTSNEIMSKLRAYNRDMVCEWATELRRNKELQDSVINSIIKERPLDNDCRSFIIIPEDTPMDEIVTYFGSLVVPEVVEMIESKKIKPENVVVQVSFDGGFLEVPGTEIKY